MVASAFRINTDLVLFVPCYFENDKRDTLACVDDGVMFDGCCFFRLFDLTVVSFVGLIRY